MYSFLMESFNEKEQAQVMQMVAFICGFAGIVGYVLCALLPISNDGVLQLDIFFISVAVFLVCAILNLCSVKEEPKEEETRTSVLSVFQNIPAKLLKMCLLFLLIFSACFPFYIFFTTCYAESMFKAHRPTIAASGNLTEEEIEIIFTDRITEGSQEASLLFIAFPAGVMIFSLVMEKGKIFRRFGIKNTIVAMLIFMIGTLTFNIFFKTTTGFFLIAIGIAISMVIQIRKILNFQFIFCR
jgi:Ca2+/Na+ antiporter